MRRPVLSDRVRQTHSRKPLRLKKSVYILLALILAGILWCGYVWIKIHQAESTLQNKSEVGIVLGASMWGDHPSPGLRERLVYALKLYEEGHFENFIVSGGLDKPGYNYTEAEGMRNFLVAEGVPEEVIYLENKATSTYENLLFSQQIMNDQGWSEAVIITHDYHGTRSMEVANTLGYQHPQLAVTQSTVLPMIKHKSREVLAYTKWTADRILIALNWK
ncbi:YdcF family protein [Paenibacillus lemnae]|uniref:YdcF family protein n=1 Tax=Paenibacillus lemnae TaxID=1330551 RepID=A0A848MA07_PAELE|nr:YdcF family protein [Paenibacillus lemnae]NMO97089.1 YdcF family protein [Paenibacillus lemnae]